MKLIQKSLFKIYKKYGSFNLYFFSFALSILACFSLGILTLFSIFTQPLESILNYSQSTINNIIIFQTLGLNCFTPLSGYIADAKGIWILSIISFFGYFIGFNLILLVLRSDLDVKFIYLGFFIIGCAHASFLFSCLLNSAKSLGRFYRTLSISTPNMMVSFSSYIEIQILSKYFSNQTNEKENFINIINFFLYFLMICTLISLISCKLTDYIEFFEFDYDETTDSITGHQQSDFINFDTSPLLTGAATVIHTPNQNSNSIIGSPRSWYVEDTLNLDDELSMLSSSTHLQHSQSFHNLNQNSSYRQKVNAFLVDPLMYPLIFCCLISICTTEFFISNLSSILGNLNESILLDKNLKLLSISSTITRFIVMILTDFFCTNFKVSRLTIFTILVLACGIGHIYLSSVPLMKINFKIVVISNAILNSAVFTLFPAILASIYGLDILGTTWGIFTSSSIIGNLFFNTLYSNDFTNNCVKNLGNDLVICSTLTFFSSGCSLILFGLVVYWLRGKYLLRAGEFF